MARILKHIDDYFLLIILLASLYFVYLIFKPFIWIILISTVLALLFYPIYRMVRTGVNGRINLASLITTLLVVLIILIPLFNFTILLSKKSVEAYSYAQQSLSDGVFESWPERFSWLMTIKEKYLFFIDFNSIQIKEYAIDIVGKLHGVVLDSTASLIKGTTQVITGFFLVFLTMFFLFRDGKKLLDKVMYVTPLANRYDKEIFEEFRKISISTISSSFLIAIMQGIIGGIGFFIVSLPAAFFLAVAMAFSSLIPFIGTMLIWLPTGIILLIAGHIWQGIFILLWGALIVSASDNFIKPFLIKGNQPIHPLLVFFSIIGGIAAFGVWGIVFGPVALAVFLTILHIYEIEYARVLGK